MFLTHHDNSKKQKINRTYAWLTSSIGLKADENDYIVTDKHGMLFIVATDKVQEIDLILEPLENNKEHPLQLRFSFDISRFFEPDVLKIVYTYSDKILPWNFNKFHLYDLGLFKKLDIDIATRAVIVIPIPIETLLSTYNNSNWKISIHAYQEHNYIDFDVAYILDDKQLRRYRKKTAYYDVKNSVGEEDWIIGLGRKDIYTLHPVIKASSALSQPYITITEAIIALVISMLDYVFLNYITLAALLLAILTSFISAYYDRNLPRRLVYFTTLLPALIKADSDTNQGITLFTTFQHLAQKPKSEIVLNVSRLSSKILTKILLVTHVPSPLQPPLSEQVTHSAQSKPTLDHSNSIAWTPVTVYAHEQGKNVANKMLKIHLARQRDEPFVSEAKAFCSDHALSLIRLNGDTVYFSEVHPALIRGVVYIEYIQERMLIPYTHVGVNTTGKDDHGRKTS